ncbi:MAG: hypothetical protein AAF226_02690 [Verrucomicrobiota bacterium]
MPRILLPSSARMRGFLLIAVLFQSFCCLKTAVGQFGAETTQPYGNTQADRAGRSIAEALGKAFSNKKSVAALEAGESYNPPANKISSMENAVTPSGSRLKPFGEESTWAGADQPLPDDGFGLLPPLPDLRTPDQISRAEKARNFRVANFAERKAEQAEKERIAELERELANRPPPDPSTALVQVSSQVAGAHDPSCNINGQRPMTKDSRGLKPFNSDSTFVKDGQVQFRGSDTIGQVYGDQTVIDPAEESLGILPPLPDLRTPDQVTKADKRRTFRIAKFAERKAEQEAIDALEAITVDTAPPHPSTAQYQVQSKKHLLGGASPGPMPTTNTSFLKPFNKDSAYYSNGGAAYRGSDTVQQYPAAAEDSLLGGLPVIPDLRTPDQVSTADKRRNSWVSKFALRKGKESPTAAPNEVSLAPQSPSSAQYIVSSQKSGQQGAYCPPGHLGQAPITPADSTLKPFNSDSVYFKGNQVAYQGNDYTSQSYPQDIEVSPFGELPPMPDLRTPDQVTKPERFRNLRKAKMDSRHAKELARQRELEASGRPVVNLPF